MWGPKCVEYLHENSRLSSTSSLCVKFIPLLLYWNHSQYRFFSSTFRILNIYEALPIMGLPVHFWSSWNCDCLGVISLDAWKHSEKTHWKDSKVCKITRHSEQESQREVKPCAIHYGLTKHKARTFRTKGLHKALKTFSMTLDRYGTCQALELLLPEAAWTWVSLQVHPSLAALSGENCCLTSRSIFWALSYSHCFPES